MFQVLTTRSTKQTCSGLHQEYVHRWELKLETNLTAFHTWLVVSHLYMCINVPCTCSIMFPPKWMKALGWKLWDLPGIGDPAEHGILMECDGILIHFLWDLPSGFYTKPTGKIHHAFLMGKSTISMAVFNSYVRNLKWSIFFSDDADTSQRGHDLKLSRSIECTLWTATGPLGSLGSLGPWGHYM